MKTLEKYKVNCDGVIADVIIYENKEKDKFYKLDVPEITKPTKAYLDVIKEELIKDVQIAPSEIINQKTFKFLRKKFKEKAIEIISKNVKNLSKEKSNFLATRLTQEMIGLGKMDFLLSDPNLEEICVNSSNSPVFIYHRKYGWLITNLKVDTEEKIVNYASMIGRRVGRSINILSPMLDSYLSKGERVNATIYPISIFGNTLTIRKFSERPWTIVDYIKQGVLSPELAAVLWLALHYELNVLITGGTASGKTSMLNVLTAFLPKNQRIISIEEIKELNIPKMFQWVSLLARPPNPEGKGEVSMLDLLINSLRMRPDRIVVGEVRRKEEAEMLFEAMHTGHAIMATIHAETSDQLERRLTNPPFSLPSVLLESLHLILTMYRDRRSGIRRVFEVNEIIPALSGRESMLNPLYKWIPSKDKFLKVSNSIRLMEMIKMFTRMSDSEIKKDLENRKKIINFVTKQNITDQNKLAEIFNKYNLDPSSTMDEFRHNPKVLLK